jgi:hypothetical protein
VAGVSGEFLGGVAVKPHEATGKDGADLLDVEGEMTHFCSRAADQLPISLRQLDPCNCVA